MLIIQILSKLTNGVYVTKPLFFTLMIKSGFTFKESETELIKVRSKKNTKSYFSYN